MLLLCLGVSVFIGSLSPDPRSDGINTRTGLIIGSPELSQQVDAFMDEGVDLRNSYRMIPDDDGDVGWQTLQAGQPVVYRVEPGRTFPGRFSVDLTKLLPLDS
jgi:hypothetical protein